MKINRLFGAVVLSIISILPASGQKPHLYTSESDLPNSKINSICQDRKGFVWIGTEAGIARFDGMDFTSFHNDIGNSPESEITLAMLEDSRGTKWVGTSLGLQIYDEGNNAFHYFDLKDSDISESNPYIYAIIEIPEKNGKSSIVVSTSRHGIYVIDADTHVLDNSRRESLNGIPGSDFANYIFHDSSGLLWIGSEFGGISAMDWNSSAPVNGLWSPADRELSETVLATVFAEDSKTGNIIIGTTNSGILIFDRELGRIRAAKDATARGCKAMALLKDTHYHRAGDRLFLVGTENNGIKLFDLETESVSDAYFYDVPYNTGTWKIHSLMEDSQGNIWAGAYQKGLLLIPQSMFGFYCRSFSTDNTPGENCACVTSIIEDTEKKAYWVGTDGGGLFHIDAGNTTTSYTDSNSPLPDNSIMSLAIDRNNVLWVATYLNGLTTYTPSRGFRPFSENNKLGTSKVFCLSYDRERDILYAGTHGNGLSVIQASTGKVLRTISEDLNKWINTLFVDKGGMLWIGTNNGPVCYNPEEEKMYAFDFSDEIKLSRVSAISQSGDGAMWIGTDRGLVSVTSTGEMISILTEKDGLSDDNIHGIIEDGLGNLWISTSNGLNRFDTENKEFSRYYAPDGIQGNEFRTNALCKAKSGQLHFGGNNGICSFYPQTINQKPHETPQVYFTRLLVGGVEQFFDENSKDNVLDRNITEATSITLPFSRNAFSLQFSVPEFTNPQRIRYSYKLDKLDKEWKDVSLVKAAIYTNLPHGRYTLTVKAFFDGNKEEFTTKDIKIRILPPKSLSFWAIALYCLLAAGVVCFLLDYRRKIIKHKKEKEESDIKEYRLQMFTNLSHEIRTPLTLVMSPLKKLKDTETDGKKKDLYSLMYRNSLRILRLVNQVMDIQKVDDRQMKLHFSENDIVYLVKDIMKSFDNMAVTRKVDFKLETAEESRSLWVDESNFDKIIFNILSNAFKYTPEGGSIKIGISDEKANDGTLDPSISNYVDISVSNSGSHIAPENIGKIFDRFFQSDIKDAGSGSGIGLNLTKMLTELHHGAIKAENTADGISFVVSLPAGKSHLTQEEMAGPSAASELIADETGMEELATGVEDIENSSLQDEEFKRFKSKKSIVFVDDNIEMLNYVKSELKDAFNVEVFDNTKDAWASVTTNQPDAIITDLIMETETEGAEFCEKVKHIPGTNLIPVIILTSRTDEEGIQRCTESGADRYLTKPISTKLLKSTITQTISTRETIKNKYTTEVGYNYEEVKINSSDDKLMAKVIESIRANIDNPNYGVEDLSRDVGMSRVHMNRKLKELISLSPSNLIKAIRLKQAAYLLANNKVNISEVAYRVGFSTRSYFSSTFHDYFGLTPKEFVAKYSDEKEKESLQKLLEL